MIKTAPKFVLNDLQTKILRRIRERPNHFYRTAASLAYKFKTSTIAIVSSCRALERRGLINRAYTGDDRWAKIYWYITKEGDDFLKSY